MRTFYIGIFGIEFHSVNYGVGALAYTQLLLLDKISKKLNIDIHYFVFSNDSKLTGEDIKSKFLISGEIIIKYLIRFKTGIKGIMDLVKDIRNLDLVIDLTYGDSFSDIYGIKKFILYSIPKYMAIYNKIPLVLGPQTFGPYKNYFAKKIAEFLLSKADYIVARDIISKKFVEKISNRNDVYLSSDLAIMLPYNKFTYNCKVSNKINIGLNVSYLLWENDKNKKLKINISYRKFIHKLITALDSPQYAVHLIVHEYQNTIPNEYSLAEYLKTSYANLILAPKFESPIDAKSYISEMDFFIGARMHATIAAFSSGVPVLPISYSRKFAGLYDSLNYYHTIDLTKEKTDLVIEKIMLEIQNIDKLTLECKHALDNALNINLEYEKLLVSIINN